MHADERRPRGMPIERTLLRAALYVALALGLLAVAAGFGRPDPTGFRDQVNILIVTVALAGLAAGARRE
jgi:hypothetical protein